MSQELLKVTYTIEEISGAAQTFWGKLNNYKVFAFSGDMGAGKTTFISSLCRYLNVEDAVSSPTFSIINEYHFTVNENPCIIFHMDWYRLKSIEEAITSGIEDCLLQAAEKNTYCFIEWPEKAMPLLPANTVWLNITTDTIAQRTMSAKLIER